MGVAGFVLGPLIIVLIITTYRLYIQEKKGPGRVVAAFKLIIPIVFFHVKEKGLYLIYSDW
jgi:hypothetical protein